MGQKWLIFAIVMAGTIICVLARLFNFGWLSAFVLFFSGIGPILLLGRLSIYGYFAFTAIRIEPESTGYVFMTTLLWICSFIICPDIGDTKGTYAIFGIVNNPPNFFFWIALMSIIAGLKLDVSFLKKRFSLT